MSAIINIKNIKVIGVKRLNNSFMGNPKYKFHFAKSVREKNIYTKVTDNQVTTPSNAGWVYAFSTDTFINKIVDISYHITKSGKAILNSIKEVKIC